MQNSAFLYIGTDGESFPLYIPCPTIGKMAFESTADIVTVTTADGGLAGQLRGKAHLVQEVGWSRIEPQTWWEICRWFEAYGPFCFVKYFSHNFGEWRTGQFLCKTFSCEPVLLTADGSPRWYENAKFQVQSTGG